MKMVARGHMLLGMIVGVSLLAGCAGTAASPQPTTEADQTYPESLPTGNGGDPFDTFPPESTSGSGPSSTPSTAVIICGFEPPSVGAGGSVVLRVTEAGDWFGTDRYYTVTGVPDLQYQEFHKADGGIGPHYPMGFDVPEYLAGAGLTIGVVMRDWDVHAPPALPGTATGSGRPESTRHEWSCSVALNVLIPVSVLP